MKKWVQLTKEQAMQHKLYGSGGWLIVFYVLFVWNILAAVGHSARVVNEQSGSLGISVLVPSTNPVVFGVQLVDWFQFALYATILFLALTKKTNFRKLSNILLVTFVLLKPLILFLTGNFVELVSFPFYLFFIGCVLLYLNVSKRVRVTYEWMVKSTDTTLTEPPYQSPKPKVAKGSSIGERIEPTF